MTRASLSYNWTAEDRLTLARWTRGLVVLYSSAVILLLAVAGMGMLSSVVPNRPNDHLAGATPSDSQRSVDAHNAICAGKRAESCTGISTGNENIATRPQSGGPMVKTQ
jgi:hypothetical protein